jgi:hypothetical protein
MSQTLVGDQRSACPSCKRTVRMVSVDGKLTAVDPEVIAVIPSGQHGGALSSARQMTGRRVHADVCDSYQRQDQRIANRREMAAYTKRNSKKSGGL